MTTLENLFALLVMFAQLAALFTVAAILADYVVTPIVRRIRR